jgi:hypothetical protein
MESPTGIIPEELMYPQRKRQAKAWIMSMPYTSQFKSDLWKGWCVTVGLMATRLDYADIEASGIDAGKSS